MWVRTYQILPVKTCKIVIDIVEKFDLDIEIAKQEETLLSSVAISLSYIRKSPMDNACLKRETCKFGCSMRLNGQELFTWCLLDQLLYNLYDKKHMNSDKTKIDVF